MSIMNSYNIRLIIFDLGNVIFEVNNQNIFQHWAQVTSLPEEFFTDHRVPDMISHQFERGELTPEEFHRVTDNGRESSKTAIKSDSRKSAQIDLKDLSGREIEGIKFMGQAEIIL